MKIRTIFRRLLDLPDFGSGAYWMARRGFYDPDGMGPSYHERGKWKLYPEAIFHKRVLVKAGHWKYLGYEVKRDDEGKWWDRFPSAHNPNNDKQLLPQRSLTRVCQGIWHEYVTLLVSVDDLERERIASKIHRK